MPFSQRPDEYVKYRSSLDGQCLHGRPSTTGLLVDGMASDYGGHRFGMGRGRACSYGSFDRSPCVLSKRNNRFNIKRFHLFYAYMHFRLLLAVGRPYLSFVLHLSCANHCMPVDGCICNNRSFPTS